MSAAALVLSPVLLTVPAVVVATMVPLLPDLLVTSIVVADVMTVAIVVPLPAAVMLRLVPLPATVLAGAVLQEPGRHVTVLDPDPTTVVIVGPVPVVAPAHPVPTVDHVEVVIVVLDDVHICVDDDQRRGNLEADLGHVDGDLDLRKDEGRQEQGEQCQERSHRVLSQSVA